LVIIQVVVSLFSQNRSTLTRISMKFKLNAIL